MVAAFRALIDFKITGSYFLEVNKSIYLIVPDRPSARFEISSADHMNRRSPTRNNSVLQFFNAQRSSVLVKIKGNRKIDVVSGRR